MSDGGFGGETLWFGLRSVYQTAKVTHVISVNGASLCHSLFLNFKCSPLGGDDLCEPQTVKITRPPAVNHCTSVYGFYGFT